jgi:hypothetical protein
MSLCAVFLTRAIYLASQIANPEQADAIDLFIAKLMKIIKCESEFIFILEDPAGNSYIESFPGNLDSNLKIETYERSDYQDGLLGINKAIHDKLTARASSIRPAAEAQSYVRGPEFDIFSRCERF